jgi:outer membrane protein assembly factor BamB
MRGMLPAASCCSFFLALFAFALPAADAPAKKSTDWPQWRGPDRNGLSSETGLLKSWPTDGPRVVWKAEQLGVGYSSIVVANGRIYTQGKVDDQERIFALDESTGSRVWAVTHEGSNGDAIQKRGDGPRGTPTVEGDRVYVESATGVVSCLEAATGTTIWTVHLVKHLGGKVPNWGYSESPLIDGDRVIVTPGGSGGTVAALNKSSGEVVWRSEITDPAHYCSPILVTVDGMRQIIQFTNSRVVGLDATNGKLLWSYSGSANRTANCSTPIYADGLVFSATAYNTGGGLVRLARKGDAFEAEEVYFLNEMQNHHGGMVLVDGFLYGFGKNSLLCVNFKTGEIAWENRSVNKGSLCYADGQLYCLGERQEVALVDANPKEYVEKGRFRIPVSGASSWAHPVVANGRFYIRDQETLTCYDVRSSTVTLR